jgi:hypothetical protein
MIVPTRNPQELRAEALALLQRANTIDGMGPYLVTHGHANGFDSYILWAAGVPTVDKAVELLDIVYEPEKGETLKIEPSFALEDFTCQFPNRMLPPGDADGEDDTAYERPRG